MPADPQVHWINKGRPGCAGNAITTVIAGGQLLRTSCDRCPLEWTTPNLGVRHG